MDDLMFAHKRPGTVDTKGVCLKRLNRGQQGNDIAAYTQTDPPEGSIGPGAESDIYDCRLQLKSPAPVCVLIVLEVLTAVVQNI